MNCDPNSLMQLARCLRCIPPGMQNAVKTSLLCQWSQEPACVGVCWEPEDQQVRWSEDFGATWQTGDLAFFKANANEAALTSLDFETPAAAITSLTGLSTAPVLDLVNVNGTLLTTLDCSQCLALTLAQGGFCPLLQTVIMTGCGAIDSVQVPSSPNVTSLVDILDCGVMYFLDISGCNILGTLDLTNLAGLASIFGNGNVNMTGLVLAGCVGLAGFDVSGCDLTSLVLTDCTVLGAFSCSNQVTGLTILTLPVSLVLNFVDANTNALPQAQVDAIYANLNANDQALGGEVDLTGGTNSMPTGGCANADVVSLKAGGWTVYQCP